MWEQWKTLRSRLGSPQHTHSLILAVLWPLAILIIAVLAMRYVTTRLIPLTQAASATALTDVWGPTDSHTRTVVRIAGERNSGVRRRPEASGDHGISYRGLPESTG